MIFSVYPLGTDNRILGIVNEATKDEAERAARAFYGRVWDKLHARWLPRELTVVPGQTSAAE